MKNLLTTLVIGFIFSSQIVAQTNASQDSFYRLGYINYKGIIQKQTIRTQIPVVVFDTNFIKYKVFYSHCNAAYLFFYPNKKNSDSASLDSISLGSVKSIRENRLGQQIAGTALIGLGGAYFVVSAFLLYAIIQYQPNFFITYIFLMSSGFSLESTLGGVYVLRHPRLTNKKYDIVSYQVPIKFHGSKFKIRWYIHKYNKALKKRWERECMNREW